jgi:hypothetical protein
MLNYTISKGEYQVFFQLEDLRDNIGIKFRGSFRDNIKTSVKKYIRYYDLNEGTERQAQGKTESSTHEFPETTSRCLKNTPFTW